MTHYIYFTQYEGAQGDQLREHAESMRKLGNDVNVVENLDQLNRTIVSHVSDKENVFVATDSKIANDHAQTFKKQKLNVDSILFVSSTVEPTPTRGPAVGSLLEMLKRVGNGNFPAANM